jgi:hypothetical protein
VHDTSPTLGDVIRRFGAALTARLEAIRDAPVRTDLSHAFAPIAVDTSTPLDDCRSVIPLTVIR